MTKYEFRPEVALSDTAFYAYGKTPAELIENACEAVTASMVEVDRIEEKTERLVTKSADTLESLLYEVLEEVIYLKDAEQLVFRSFKVTQIQTERRPMSVTIQMRGEVIDRERHQAHADVKAVTYQDFKIDPRRRIKGVYRASVTLDI